MNMYLLMRAMAVLFLVAPCSGGMAAGRKQTPATTLRNVSVHKVGLARRVTFEFSGPFVHQCSSDEHAVRLHFPAATLRHADTGSTVQALRSLPHVEAVRFERDEAGNGINCYLSFDPRCVVVANPKRMGTTSLICEIFKRNRLDRIKHAPSGPITHA